MKNKQLGSSPVMIVLLIAIVLLVACAGAFYMLKSQGKLPGYSNDAMYTNPSPTDYVAPPAEESEEVSAEDDLSTMQAELEGTSEGSLESDFSELDLETTSL